MSAWIVWLRCRVEIADEKRVVISVGDATTRARVVRLSDGGIALWPDDDVVVDGQAVSVRAERPDSPALRGTAAVVRSGRAFDEARVKLRKKYGWRARFSHPDAVVVVRLAAG